MNNKQFFLETLWTIRKREYWTQQFFAVDKHGSMVEIMDENACSFCSLGAISRVANTFRDNMDYPANTIALEVSDYCRNKFGVWLSYFNDANDYDTVIAMWLAFGVEKGYIDSDFTMDQLETLRNQT